MPKIFAEFPMTFWWKSYSIFGIDFFKGRNSRWFLQMDKQKCSSEKDIFFEKSKAFLLKVRQNWSRRTFGKKMVNRVLSTRLKLFWRHSLKPFTNTWENSWSNTYNTKKVYSFKKNFNSINLHLATQTAVSATLPKTHRGKSEDILFKARKS